MSTYLYVDICSMCTYLLYHIAHDITILPYWFVAGPALGLGGRGDRLGPTA